MRVTQIETSDYRNLQTQTVVLGNQLNIFTGINAQGKTNLLETVYLCCIGKSPRTDKTKELINWTKTNARVKVRYENHLGGGETEVILLADGKKQISANGNVLKRTGDLMERLNCVYFSPAEIRIISQSPAERRHFLDVDLCQTDKNYYYSLARFNKALEQRNAVLKRATSVEEVQENTYEWNAQLADEGARIIAKRKEFCAKLKVWAKKCHEKLTNGKETLDLDYATSVTGETIEEIAVNYLALLQNNAKKDYELRYTFGGCQRDDIMLKVNGTDVRSYGSQGQLRTTALALKLAELCIFKEMLGEYPVLLLDDVLSELDDERQEHLLHFDKNLQILLTSATAVPSALAKDATNFVIENGKCTKK